MRSARYEILLPLQLNDGSPVDPRLFQLTRRELLSRFEGLSQETGRIQGTWIHRDVEYEDELLKWTIECEDTRANRQFFLRFKETLKERFQQLEIRIVSHRIDVL